MRTTNETDYDVAELIGNVTVPRLALPTVRSSIRRSDADGLSDVPYYSGISGQKLDIEYTDGALAVQTVSLTIAGDGYADLIASITALDPTNIEAIDMGGFLGIRNTNSGDTHYIKILPQGTPSEEAADLIGLEVDPFPGSISYAGELASTPGTRIQANPQGTALITRGEDLSGDALNRALVSILRSVERLRADFERETLYYKTFSVTVQNHEVSTSVKGFYMDYTMFGGVDVHRIPIASGSGTGAITDSRICLFDSTGLNEAIVNIGGNRYRKTQISNIHYADSTTAIDVINPVTTWGTPNGCSIFGNDAQVVEKHPAATITSIKGNILYCAGATFETNLVQKNDPILIQNATNTSPYGHNGWFAVQEVIDEEHVKVRPLGTNELDEGWFDSLSDKRPFAINSTGGSGFGDVTVYIGHFFPMRDVFVTIDSSYSIPNGSYVVRMALGRPLREHQVDAFPGGNKGDTNAGLLAHLGTAYDHEYGYIGGGTLFNTWFNGTAISSSGLDGMLEQIIYDLASIAGTDLVSGAERIGSAAITTSGGGASKTLSADSIYNQLGDFLEQFKAHEVSSSFHPNTGIVSGFTANSYVYPNQTITTGVLVAVYGGEVRRFAPSTGLTFNATLNSHNYVYLDLADNTIKNTGTIATAFTATTVPLYWIRPIGFSLQWVYDFRIPLSSNIERNRGMVTVGPAGSGSDFPDIESAFAWIGLVRQGYYTPFSQYTTPIKTWEVVVQGTVTMLNSVFITFPVILRGAAKDASGLPLCKVTTPEGIFSGRTIAFQASMEFVTGPGYTYASSVIIRDLYFEVPSATPAFNSRVIGGSAFGHEYGDNWLIENCVFSGGTNAPYIDIDPHSVIPKNWTIKDCWFKTSTRTSETAHVKIKRASGFLIDNCKFEGQTADTLNMGISLYQGLVDELTISNCSFEMGGRHLYIVPGTIDFIKVKNCRFKSSRGPAITHQTGELVVDDCLFNGCMTNPGASEAVILSDSSDGKLIVVNSRFKNWVSDHAIRGITNTSVNSRFVNNIFTVTGGGSDRCITGFSHALFMGNDFDMLVGASSGFGKNITTVLTTISNCRIVNNYFKNCGSTASASGDTVLTFTSNCIVSGNMFINCRGVLIDADSTKNTIFGNLGDDVGVSANDKGVTIGGADNVVMGNILPHATSATPIEVQAINLRAHTMGNAVANGNLAPITGSSTVGLTGPISSVYYSASIGSVGPIPGSSGVIVAVWDGSDNVFGTHLPISMSIPNASGNLRPQIRCLLDDGSEVMTDNATYTVSGFNPIPVGRSIIQVQLVVMNDVGSPSGPVAFGTATYKGWLVG